MRDSFVPKTGSRTMGIVHLQYRPKLKVNLTKREREIIYYICLGNTLKEVGKILYLSPSTVISHKRSIFLKFDINSLVRLGVLAERYGLTKQPMFQD